MKVVAPYTILSRHDPAANSTTILHILHGRRKSTAAMLSSN